MVCPPRPSISRHHHHRQEESATNGHEAAVEALPPTGRKNVRATMRDGSGLMLEPLPPVTAGGPTRTRASLVVHMEPKMYMPGWLVKWFLGTVSPFVRSCLRACVPACLRACVPAYCLNSAFCTRPRCAPTGPGLATTTNAWPNERTNSLMRAR